MSRAMSSRLAARAAARSVTDQDRLKRVEEDSETLRARLTDYESALPKTIDDAVSERLSKVAEVSNFFELRDARWALGAWALGRSA